MDVSGVSRHQRRDASAARPAPAALSRTSSTEDTRSSRRTYCAASTRTEQPAASARIRGTDASAANRSGAKKPSAAKTSRLPTTWSVAVSGPGGEDREQVPQRHQAHPAGDGAGPVARQHDHPNPRHRPVDDADLGQRRPPRRAVPVALRRRARAHTASAANGSTATVMSTTPLNVPNQPCQPLTIPPPAFRPAPNLPGPGGGRSSVCGTRLSGTHQRGD